MEVRPALESRRDVQLRCYEMQSGFQRPSYSMRAISHPTELGLTDMVGDACQVARHTWVHRVVKLLRE